MTELYTPQDLETAAALRYSALPEEYDALPDETRARVRAATSRILEKVAPAIAAKALRDHADEVERELVCCDAYDGKGSAGKHEICYWGGAAVHIARHRADELGGTK